MADVYLAQDERLRRPVAVKVLKRHLARDHEFLERFRREAQAAASLRHGGVVAVYDRDTADGVTYIAMEYIRGESLKQRIRRDGALPAEEAVATALAVLSALGAAHERAVIHRDVTSHNVLLEEGGRVVVADFGIARVGVSALTRTGVMMGTSSYLSPEQAQGRPADERSDLYSLGVVLFEMLTGRLPFRGESDLAVAMQHVSSAPSNPRSLAPGVSEALAGVVLRALSKDPGDRYRTAEEFAAALRAASRPAKDGGAVAASHSDAAVSPPPPPPAAPDPSPATVRQSVSGLAQTTADASEAPPYHQPDVRPSAARQAFMARSRRVILALVLVTLAVAGGWAAYVYLFAHHATVPAMIGERRPVATAAVRDQGLHPELHFVWSDKFADGEVVRQVPRGGTRVEKGVSVGLWVSRGPLHIPAPDLSGLAPDVARSVLAGDSLKYKSRRVASRSGSRGKVFRQEPVAGATVRRGDTVTFWVSSGPPRVVVPDVVGLSQGKAVEMLEEAGFVVSTDYVAGWGEVPGTVTAQEPVAGARARTGDEVVVKVAVL